MDEEKDLYIKNKLQEDKLISKKADDIFNKIIKGEFIMDEQEKQANTEQTNDTKNKVIKFNKWKKVLATAACLVLLIGAANVYATSQGYENVFFMIKYLVTGEGKVEGKDNILSDRDITISYEPINVAKDLSVTIKKLQVKDNIAKLFVISIDKKMADKNLMPLKFIAYNDKNEKICEQTGSEEIKENRSATDELILNNFKESDNIIVLEIYGANSEKLTTLRINIADKTVEVQGEEEALQKISEIELKNFLGYVGGLSEKTELTDNELKIALAGEMLEEKEGYSKIEIDDYTAYKVDDINKTLESFIGEKIENFNEGKILKSVTKDGVKYYKYIVVSDGLHKTECINISNISYCNGVYTVNYSYYNRYDVPDEDIVMDDYDIYEQEVCISLNDNDNYSKFKVVSMEEPTKIREAKTSNQNNSNEIIENNTSNNEQTTNNNSNDNNSNTNTSNNTSNEKINNYASTMSWTNCWAPSMKFQYPTIFKLEEVGGEDRGTVRNDGKVATKITGIATGIDPDTKARIDSDLEIRIYQPSYTEEDINKYKYDENGNERSKLTTNGLDWYITTEGDDNKDYTETYTHIEYFHDGTWTIFKIEFENKGKYSFKVRNITNWLMGTVRITDF